MVKVLLVAVVPTEIVLSMLQRIRNFLMCVDEWETLFSNSVPVLFREVLLKMKSKLQDYQHSRGDAMSGKCNFQDLVLARFAHNAARYRT